MARFPAGLVWLASYPKSGNTWARLLLANLVAGGDDPVDINQIGDDGLIGRGRFCDDVLVDADLLTWEERAVLRRRQTDFVTARLTTATFLKTHECFADDDGLPSLGTAARAVVYLVRDPRDVAISYAHHGGVAVDDAIARMTDPGARAGGPLQLPYRLGDWAGHVAGWTGQTAIPTRVLRYEAMRLDTAAALADIVAFLGGWADAAEIDRAVAHSRFDELSRQEAAHGFRENTPWQPRFFRSGTVGAWRDVLTAAQVLAIEARFGAEMTRLGYDLAG